ncbi:ATP-dependent zinc metalloprotease FtsH [bacterium HR39]|nr:ATP-dependent zinc metalloprotease FtsH [bacterium HR39]
MVVRTVLEPFHPFRLTPTRVMGEALSGLYVAFGLGFLAGGGLLPDKGLAAVDLIAWASLIHLLLNLPLALSVPKPSPAPRARTSPQGKARKPLRAEPPPPPEPPLPPPEPPPPPPEPPPPEPVRGPEPPSPKELEERLERALVLPERAREEILKVARVMADPEGYKRTWGMDPPRGLLLHGPPGTGKTSVARFLAKELSVPLFVVNPGELKSKWYGETEARVKALLEEAGGHPTSMVFVDEAETLLGNRNEIQHETSRSIVALFLQGLEGFYSPAGHLFLVLATNHPERIDPALLSRLSFRVELPLPGPREREAILKLLLPKGRYREEDLDEVVRATEGFSGRDLRALAQRATLRAHLEGRDTVSLQDFLAELPGREG